MQPTELLSVRIFKQIVTRQLDSYQTVDDAKVLKTLQLVIGTSFQDSVAILKDEIGINNIDFSELLEEFITELADQVVQNASVSDPVIEQIALINFLSFNEKVNNAKEIQDVIKRLEYKNLKQLLEQSDEQQEIEDLQIALQRTERKILKQKLILEENNITNAASYHTSNAASYVFNDEDNSEKVEDNVIPISQIPLPNKKGLNRVLILRIAAIFIIILIPAGILFYINSNNGDIINISFKNSKSNNSEGSSQSLLNTDNSELLAALDIQEYLNMDIPKNSVLSGISKMIGDVEVVQGYASEDKNNVQIEIISSQNQIDYLNERISGIDDKISRLKSFLNQDLKKEEIDTLNLSLEKLLVLKQQSDKKLYLISKTNLNYNFDGEKLILYLNKNTNPDRFKVRAELDYESDEKKYFLLLDDKELKEIKISY
jgi:hypothetical protein